MKIAIISDVHGNYTALKRVLDDISKKGIKEIYCLGDTIGKGVNSNKCLDLLKDTKMVYGNWEDFINNKLYNSAVQKKVHEKVSNQLSEENKTFIKKLPFCKELYISGRLVRMFHASPSSAWDNILEIDRIEKLYNQFLPSSKTSDEKADIVIFGHTHKQNMIKLYNRTLINCGSVGNAFEVIRNDEKNAKNSNTTNADYLIIDGDIGSKVDGDISFEFVSLKYDIDQETNENSGNDSDFIDELQSGKYRFFEKYEENFKSSHYDINNI